MALPLTIGQLKSLFFISNEGGTSSKKLAEALGVTPTNVTGIVDRLVKQGLVSRAEDPNDRRMLLLKSTKAGEELIYGLRERKRTGFSRVLAGMGDDELLVLQRGLTSLVKAIQRYEDAG